MPDESSTERDRELQTLLLNFVVEQILKFDGDIGSLSPTLAAAVKKGAREAVNEEIHRYGAERADEVANRIWPALATVVDALSADLRRLTGEELQQRLDAIQTELTQSIAAEARDAAQQAVKAGLDDQPQITRALQRMARQINALGQYALATDTDKEAVEKLRSILLAEFDGPMAEPAASGNGSRGDRRPFTFPRWLTFRSAVVGLVLVAVALALGGAISAGIQAFLSPRPPSVDTSSAPTLEAMISLLETDGDALARAHNRLEAQSQADKAPGAPSDGALGQQASDIAGAAGKDLETADRLKDDLSESLAALRALSKAESLSDSVRKETLSISKTHHDEVQALLGRADKRQITLDGITKLQQQKTNAKTYYLDLANDTLNRADQILKTIPQQIKDAPPGAKTAEGYSLDMAKAELSKDNSKLQTLTADRDKVATTEAALLFMGQAEKLLDDAEILSKNASELRAPDGY